MGRGYDIVIEIGERQAGALAVALAQRSARASCRTLGGVRVGVWPTSIRFREEGGREVALVNAETTTGPVNDFAVLLAEAVGDARPAIFAGLTPLAELMNSEVRDVGFKLVDRGLAVGVDFWGGTVPDADRWSAFEEDFRAGSDWAIFLDRRLLTQFIRNRVRDALAGQNLGVRIETIDVDWRADRFTIRVGAAYRTPITFFRTFDVGVTIEATYSFALNERRELALVRRHARLEAGTTIQIIEWALDTGRPLREDLDMWTSPDRFVEPYPLIFPLPAGAALLADMVEQTDDGLLVRGEMRPPSVLVPRLEVPAEVGFLEEHASACGGAPTYIDKTIYIRNAGVGRLFICSVAIDGRHHDRFSIISAERATIRDDGRSLFFSGEAGLDNQESLAVRLRYAGPRGEDADAVLEVLTNDPRQAPRSTPADRDDPALAVGRTRLMVRQAAAPVWVTDPLDTLNIRVANTPPGETATFVAQRCVETTVRRPASALERPAGEIRVINLGTTAVHLCTAYVIGDPSFTLDEPSTRTVEAGRTIALGIRYFPTAVGVPSNGRLVLVDQTGSRREIAISARVDPQSTRVPFERRLGSPAVEMIVDAIRNSVCAPLPAGGEDLCAMRDLVFEPITGSRVGIAVVEVGPVAPRTPVRFGDREGRELVTDISPDVRRAFALGPIGGPFDPCRLRLDGVDPASRVRLSGLVLERVGVLPGTTGVAVAGERIVVTTADALRVLDWRGPEPTELARLSLPEPRGLLVFEQHLTVTSRGEPLSFDLSRSGDEMMIPTGTAPRAPIAPPVRDAHVSPCGEGAVAAHDCSLWLLGHEGEVLCTRRLDHSVVHISAGATVAAVTTTGGTFVYRVSGGTLELVTHFARPHWSHDYLPAPARRLLRQTPGGTELWSVAPQLLRRSRFPDLFGLRVAAPHALPAGPQPE